MGKTKGFQYGHPSGSGSSASGLNEPYFIRRRWDYFVTWLMVVTPPDNYLIVPPPDFRPNAPPGPDPDDDQDPDGWPYWKAARVPN